jgi:hypothetical protein
MCSRCSPWRARSPRVITSGGTAPAQVRAPRRAARAAGPCERRPVARGSPASGATFILATFCAVMLHSYFSVRPGKPRAAAIASDLAAPSPPAGRWARCTSQAPDPAQTRGAGRSTQRELRYRDGSPVCRGRGLRRHRRALSARPATCIPARRWRRLRSTSRPWTAATTWSASRSRPTPTSRCWTLLARRGAGFDIVSVGELERVLAAGGDPARWCSPGSSSSVTSCAAPCRSASAASTSNPPRSSTAAGRRRGIRRPARAVSLRVNPDVDARTHPYISTGSRRTSSVSSTRRPWRCCAGPRPAEHRYRRPRLPHRLTAH